MSALGRINLLVSLFFAVVTLICMAILLRQAGDDVHRELAAAQGVVDYLADSVRRSPDSLPPHLGQSLRHVRAEWLAAGQAVPPEAGPDDWLGRWLYPEVAPARLIALDDGRRLRLAVDPGDEIDEVWDSLRQLLGLLGLSLLLCLLAIRWAVRHALGVLEELLTGLQQISQGQLDTRLTSHRLPEAQRLAGHFNRMASALQHAEAENQRLNQALLRLQEHERNRLAQTLHDDLGQYLAGIRAQACLFGLLAENPQGVRDAAQRLEAHCVQLQEGFHALVRDLYPVMLEHLPLRQAVCQLAEQWQGAQGIDCHVHLIGEVPEPSQEAKLHLYRLLQEALTNVARHSGASRVRMRLQRRGGQLRLLLRDNGHGRPAARRGIGLRSMCERARCLGGELHYRGRPGRGWTLYLNIPLEERT